MKASSLRPIAARWQIGSALLLFAVAGQAFGQISGTVTGPLPAGTMLSDLKAVVVATNNDTNEVFTAKPDDTDGTYSIDPVTNGTYKVAVVAAGFTAPAVTNVVISDASPMATENFALVVATPLIIKKSPNPIPLTDGIDSASFQDATEIDLNSGEYTGGSGNRMTWGGPSTVSGRLKVKYSDLGIHVAADVTYATPLVNNMTGGNQWNGNAFEFDIQSDPYDPTRKAYDGDHNWQLVLNLGPTTDWWLHGRIQAHPSINGNDEPVTSHVMIQEKTPDTGETFRLDIPWAILLDSTHNGISPPADNGLGAMDLLIDAAGPSGSRSDGWQLALSGVSDTYTNPSDLVPVQFVP